MSAYQQYLKTLRRVPDDVILALGTREFEMDDGPTCLCGWIVKETLEKLKGIGLKLKEVEFDSWDTGNSCQRLYGGSYGEWQDIFGGVTEEDNFPNIERAFVNRVIEAVNNQTEEK